MSGLMRVPLMEEELLTSFVSRTARANGRMRMRGFCADFGIDFDGMVRGDSSDVEMLAALVDRPYEELLLHHVRTTALRERVFRGTNFPGRAISSRPLRFCPLCLAEDELDERRMPGTRRYARFQWALRSLRTCGRHERLLVPFAFSRQNPDQNDFCALVDRTEVAAAPPGAVCDVGDFERFVLDRLGGASADDGLLAAFPLAECIDLCELFGMAISQGTRFSPKTDDDETLKVAADEGFRVLREGRSAVERALDQLARGADRRRARGPALYGTLYELLARRPTSYEPVKRIVREHSVAVVPKLSGTPVFGGSTGERWVTIAAIAQACGLSAELVSGYLRQQGHIRPSRTRPHGTEVSPTVARDATAVLTNAVTYCVARSSLGFSHREMQSVVCAGMVKPIVRHADRPTSRSPMDRYSGAEIQQLRDRLATHPHAKHDGLVSLRTAIRKTGCEPARAIALVLDRRLATLSRVPGHSALAGLMVDPAEFSQAVRAEPETEGRTSDSPADAIALESAFGSTANPELLRRATRSSCFDTPRWRPGRPVTAAKPPGAPPRPETLMEMKP
ncbi:TniQ family protein [Pararhizobium qamdonense]|uniref:TniQ family protein n=1 Tax=Pararhizobium qamdonense TaxID=3031126 RepID=UPI0023E22974|nr:TniQ family protein [Pararhizobium qamdonense]